MDFIVSTGDIDLDFYLRILLEEKFFESIKHAIDIGTIKSITDDEKLIELAVATVCITYSEFEIYGGKEFDKKCIYEAQLIKGRLNSRIKWLFENYKKNRTDEKLDRQKILLNTWKYLRSLPDLTMTHCEERIKKEFIYHMDILEHNIRDPEKLLKSMRKAGINRVIKSNLMGIEKVYYPEIIDIFRDHFLLKCSHDFQSKEIERIKRNIRNGTKKKFPSYIYSFLEMLEYVSRGRELLYVFERHHISENLDRNKLQKVYHNLFHRNEVREPNFLAKPFKKLPPDALRFRKFTKLL